MIPVRLTLNGIYSYRTQQEIDFTALTGKHIFGIFGSVGSGKSTVLEAITFALYGETERLNKGDSRNYNMMNLKSDKLFIEFEFKAGDGNNDLFKFVVTGKRDKKDFTKIAKYSRNAYKMVRDEWIPLESASGESVLGLNYDNFRRTIILPQGKFQEFLQLGGTDRTKMLLEIFNLNRFDLSRKVAVLEEKNDALLNTVTGQLSEIGDVNAEGITTLREELKKNTLAKKNIQNELAANEIEITGHEELKRLDGKISSLSVEMKRLEGLASSYDERERMLTEYEQCQKLFPDLLSRRDSLFATLELLNKKIRKDETSLKDKSSELERADSLLASLKPDYDNRQELQNKSNELLSIARVFDQQTELLKIDNEISKKNERLEKLRVSIDELQKNIASYDEKSGILRKERPDTSVLHKINEWFRVMESIEENIVKQQKKTDEMNNILNTIRGEREELLKEPLLLAYGDAERWSAQDADPAEMVKSIKKNNKSTIKKLEEQKKQLQKDLVLEHFATEMEDGKPCPLCGSEHHPAIFTATGVHDVVQKIDDEIEQIRLNEDLLGEIAGKLSVTISELRSVENNADTLRQDQAAIEEKLKTHRAAYIWPDYADMNRAKVKEQIEQSEAVEKQIADLENSRLKGQKDFNIQQGTEKQESAAVAALEKEAEHIRGAVRETLSRVRYFIVTDLQRETVQKMAKDLMTEKGRLEKEYAELSVRKTSLAAETSALNGSLASDSQTY
ncbi:MAG: AAA family ATPase, partial [Bacteroidota bacterium]